MQLSDEREQSSVHLWFHCLPPFRTVDPHEEDDRAACEADKAQNSEEPPIADAANDRGCDKGANTREDVSHEVVESHAFRGFLGHKLSEHSGHHTEDEHGTYSEEKVGNHLLSQSQHAVIHVQVSN